MFENYYRYVNDDYDFGGGSIYGFGGLNFNLPWKLRFSQVPVPMLPTLSLTNFSISSFPSLKVESGILSRRPLYAKIRHLSAYDR